MSRNSANTRYAASEVTASLALWLGELTSTEVPWGCSDTARSSRVDKRRRESAAIYMIHTVRVRFRVSVRVRVEQ